MRRALAAGIDVLVVTGLAPLALLFARSYDGFFASGARLLVAAAIAALVGTVARAVRGGVVVRALVFALLTRMLEHQVEVTLSHALGVSPLAAPWTAISVGHALPLGVAAFLVGTRPRALPLAAGLALTALDTEWPIVAVAIIALGLTDAGTRDWATVRDVLPTAGLGVLAGLVTRGLAADVATTLVPAASASGTWSWSADPPEHRVIRVAIELASLASVVAFARGRTWGLLTLLPAVIALALCAHCFDGPRWFAGCLAWGHPFQSTMAASFVVPALVAVVPWAAPLARAVRRLPSP